jgi:hypothetical protein
MAGVGGHDSYRRPVNDFLSASQGEAEEVNQLLIGQRWAQKVLQLSV